MIDQNQYFDPANQATVNSTESPSKLHYHEMEQVDKQSLFDVK